MSNFETLVGKKFSRWLVHSETDKRSRSGTVIYECLCDCGATRSVNGVTLRRGTSRSCGCLRDELAAERFRISMLTHGHTKNDKQSPAYRSWVAVKRRCLDPNFKDYPRYGGSGVTLCGAWKDFAQFYADMGDRPPGMTLDRIQNNKGYDPGNCRWATHETQMNNTGRNRNLEFQGKTQTVAEWARELGIPRARLSARLNALKWPIEKALTEGPYGSYNKH